MTNAKISPDFNLLATAANYIKNDFVQDRLDWYGSPFEWVLNLPAGTKGKLGKQLVFQWCALKNLAVTHSPDSQADMIINGHRVEIKFSTLWKAGFYKFQQIRNQNYEYCICLGVSPYEAHCWVLSKPVLFQYVIGHLGQHTGSLGKETAWLTIEPKNPPHWIIPFGGTLEKAFIVLKSLSNKK